MNRIEKFLRSLSAKERHGILLLLQQLKSNPLKVPGIIALKGLKNLYRVRIGSNRIIFYYDPASKMFELRHIGRRNENTYKNIG